MFTCFYQNNNSELTAINYNITDTKISIISSAQQSKKNNGTKFIKSILSLDKSKSLVCFTNNDTNIDCLIYNITDNTFSESKTYLTGCLSKYSSINIEYLNKLKEYILYCYQSSSQYNLMQFNINFEPIENEDNGIYDLSESLHSCNNFYSSSIVNNYDKFSNFVKFGNNSILIFKAEKIKNSLYSKSVII